MSNVATQPRTSSSPLHIPRDADPEESPEPAILDYFIPPVSEESYSHHTLTFSHSMSDVNKGPSISQVEHPLIDRNLLVPIFFPSTLAHDFLTPEYSSENQFSDPSVPTTPSWEDNWWDTKPSVDTDEPDTLRKDDSMQPSHLIVSDVPGGASRYQESNDLSAPLIPHLPTQLMSPQLTNTPSPPGHHSQSSTMAPTSVPSGPAQKGYLQANEVRSRGLRVNPHHGPAESGYRNEGLQASPSDALHPAPSPILMVSSYNRGDSPARSGFRMGRSSSKRSRTSQAPNFLAPANPYSSEEEEEEKKKKKKEDGLRQDHAQHVLSHVGRMEDGSWLPDTTSGQMGLDPTARGDLTVPSLKEMEEKRQIDEKNAEVSSWLEKSEAGSEVDEEADAATLSRRRRSTRPKPRAHSTGARTGTIRLGVPDDSGIPGPGILLDEDSEAEYTDDSASLTSADGASTSPAADVDVYSHESEGYFPSVAEVTSEQEEPLPQQFIRARLWQDVVRGPILHDVIYQPTTSNAAIYKYDQLAAKWETASRAATWGTRRRLSETDVQSIISGQSVRKLSLARKTRERGNSIVKQASKLIPRRSSSNAKKRDPVMARDNSSTESVQKKHAEIVSSLKSLQRIPSIGKAPKSPSLNTGSAFLAMTGQLTAVGRSTSATPETGGFPPGPWSALKRQRSKSEIPRTKSSGTPGLVELMGHHGGPPVPNLASPTQEESRVAKRPQERGADDDGEDADEEEEVIVDQGVRIDLKVKTDNIVPNLDGFRTHARELNPRLEMFLLERIAVEQVRRYKKLVENKVKHTHAVKNLRQCSSKSFCFELGGEAEDLPPRSSTKDPDAPCAQFQVSGNGDSDGDANTFAEGIVTAALFPPGIPLPPVKKLPAELECSLCFQVKKCQKPSDWTKHVHEDVQPFTCTFPLCSDSRSFKRKADWVRHENERHRHLEWWRCNMPECSHICYRKDNFVQHLVREHKKREPKVKSRGSASNSQAQPEADAVAAWQAQIQEAEIQEVWKLVDVCHFETQKKPRDEACKFCGNVCNSWKKLTVHLAKHMEQIAMPVLELVKRREVSADTIISPVERSSRQQGIANPATSPEGKMKAEPNALSPYVMNITPQPAGLQATQSPGSYSQDSRYTRSMQNSPNFSHTPASAYDHQAGMQAPGMAQFAQMHDLPANMSYGPYQNAQQAPSSSFVPININTGGPSASTYPPPFNAGRRSPHPMVANSSRSHPGFLQVNTMYNGQPAPPPQQTVYSSPTDTASYAAQFDVGMDQLQNYTGTMAYDQNRMSAGMVLPPNLAYDPQHDPPFLGQSYPYTSQ